MNSVGMCACERLSIEKSVCVHMGMCACVFMHMSVLLNPWAPAHWSELKESLEVFVGVGGS